jgi:hypothetical protein
MRPKQGAAPRAPRGAPRKVASEEKGGDLAVSNALSVEADVAEGKKDCSRGERLSRQGFVERRAV